MVYVCNFSEYGAPNAPSMKDYMCEKPYENQQRIIEFLNNSGKTSMVSTALPKDLITGEHISGELYTKQIDGFSWWSDLAYHVEKYNLRLSKEFEDYILNRPRP